MSDIFTCLLAVSIGAARDSGEYRGLFGCGGVEEIVRGRRSSSDAGAGSSHCNLCGGEKNRNRKRSGKTHFVYKTEFVAATGSSETSCGGSRCRTREDSSGEQAAEIYTINRGAQGMGHG